MEMYVANFFREIHLWQLMSIPTPSLGHLLHPFLFDDTFLWVSPCGEAESMMVCGSPVSPVNGDQPSVSTVGVGRNRAPEDLPSSQVP